MGFDIARSLGKIPKDQRQKTAIVPEPPTVPAHFYTPNGDVVTNPDWVQYMVIAPEELAKYQRKAALWDAYEAKRRESLSDCDCWIEDTEQLLSKLKQLRKEIEL